MVMIDRNHDPKKNAELISQLSGKNLNINELVKETNELFKEASEDYRPLNRKNNKGISSFFSNFGASLRGIIRTKSAFDNVRNFETVVDHNGNVYPEWMERLNEEYKQLLKEINREVYIEDFGAIGDGKTDCTEAFRMALGKGRVKVYIPEGVYVVKEIKLPSFTYLVGAGKRKTVIKLHDSAPKGRRLITNKNHRSGNRNVKVTGMTLDWNVERLGNVDKTSTWGNHSSCLLYANVKYGWVKDVEGVNPGLHCFDISSPLYNYYGDGYRARGGSEFIWIDNVNGYGFGDDGITTHHSDNIFISNCHMSDPSGKTHKKGFSNSNGIEIDDGSRNVWLLNNSTARCFGGVEIKAHHTSSAANNVVIIGHLSVNDNRSYNFRHIGHHKENDPESKTAINIRAANIISYKPVHTELYANSSPRAMVVSAYKNVAVNHFTAIGDPSYDYGGETAIAIQYRSRNIILKNLELSGFTNAGSDIKVFGGSNRADNVKIQNVLAKHSAPKAIQIGKGVAIASVEKVYAEAVNGQSVIELADDKAVVKEVNSKGFKQVVLGQQQI
ncbi:glycosyl hydrolase family 28-related protein [Mesobacillus selenatarsenatis]|uniref:Phage neck n=1 Tax=Mesobacillus selenatarsenatis (strain DSM 18680 / JCM 14380 / FERM P-15431 / SF-1) TaxID=1321606 RepID=A0A0A8X0Q4_MESS1|nr:glycosyl hydrolase family 28-related protein [Mesobacillus selenatarsenatis]GAM13483.1 phage neck [Mesobacillus selenatarsenatis SF-1]